MCRCIQRALEGYTFSQNEGLYIRKEVGRESWVCRLFLLGEKMKMFCTCNRGKSLYSLLGINATCFAVYQVCAYITISWPLCAKQPLKRL